MGLNDYESLMQTRNLYKFLPLLVGAALFFLYIALRLHVYAFIDKHVVSFTDVIYHWGMDLFFLFATICYISYLYKILITGKYISVKTLAYVFFICAVYLDFRSCGHYVYVGYLNSSIAYLDVPVSASFIVSVFVLLRQSRSSKSTEEARHDVLVLSDRAISSTDEDIFDLTSYVSGVVSYIKGVDVSSSSFSMGVVGEWGYGKSSFFNLVENRLKEEEGVLVVRFSPRSSRNLSHIQDDFLRELRKAIYQFHSDSGRLFEDYAEALNLRDGAPGLWYFLVGLFRMQRKSTQEIFNSVNEAIRETGKRIVVLIDDLDRLTGEELLEVFKLIDMNGDFSNTIYLSAYDKEYVNMALKDHLSHQGKEIFTDKYFEMEVRIPDHPSYILTEYLKNQLQQISRNYDFGSYDFSSLIISSSQFILPRLKTIRDIKRFVNQFIFNYSLVWREVVLYDYFLLQLIWFCHPEEYRRLLNYEYIIKGSSLSANHELIFLRKKYATTIHGHDLKGTGLPECIDILRALFPDNTDNDEWYEKRASRIYSTASFEFYFYNYECDNVRQDDVKSMFNMPLEEVFKSMNGLSQKTASQVETFLLTREAGSLDSIQIMLRLFQLLVYCARSWNSFNAAISANRYLDKDFSIQMMQGHSVKNEQEYRQHLTDALNEIFEIDPMVASSFIKNNIERLHESAGLEKNSVLSSTALVRIAENFQRTYLDSIDSDASWDAKVAFDVSLIPVKDASMSNNSIRALQESMSAHPGSYISHLMPLFNQTGTYVNISPPSGIMWSVVMSDGLYDTLFDNKAFDNHAEIAAIRNAWAVFRSLGYSEIKIPGVEPKSPKGRFDLLERCRQEAARLHDIEKRFFQESDLLLDLPIPERQLVMRGRNIMNTLLQELDKCRLETSYKESLRNKIKEQQHLYLHYN